MKTERCRVEWQTHGCMHARGHEGLHGCDCYGSGHVVATYETPSWRAGDRARWHHRSKRASGTFVDGTVTAVDEPGLPQGVRFVFDEPVHGVGDCYALPTELEPIPEGRL